MTLKKPVILLLLLIPVVLLSGCTMPTGREKFEHKGLPVSTYVDWLNSESAPGATEAELLQVLANRRVAAEALGQLGSAEEHGDMLAAVAGNPEEDLVLRTRAAWALGMLRAERYNGLLIRLLNEGFENGSPKPPPDSHWALREAAVFGLGRIGRFESRGPLEALKEVESEQLVKKAIDAALKGLSPVDYNVFPSEEDSQLRSILKLEVGVDPNPININLERLIDFLENSNRDKPELQINVYERHLAEETEASMDAPGEDVTEETPAIIAVDEIQWVKGEKVADHHSWLDGKKRDMVSHIYGQDFPLQAWRKGQGVSDKPAGSNFLPMLLLFLVFTYFWTSRLAKKAQQKGGAPAK